MDRKDALPVLVAIAAVTVLAAIVYFFGPKEKPAPISTAPTSLESVVYGGNHEYTVFQTTHADVDADGDQDAIVILTEQPGGSGTFFYVAAAIAEGKGFNGTNPILLGDRIAPQTVEFRDGKIVVNYADRAAGEPMTTQPSVGKSRYLVVQQRALAEWTDARATGCAQAGGTWLAEHEECEYVSQEWCAAQGGRFDECASACRHQQVSEGVPVMCTMQCVQVCGFFVAPNAIVPERATLEGVLTCLPHKGDGPSTMECAMGLKTDDGTYYAFDTMLMSSIPPAYDYGDRISANGVMTPIEMLSTDYWQKYDIKGIFSATDGLTIMKKASTR